MATPPINSQELGNLVRFWVHQDNLVSSLNKQAQNARQVRENFENQIIQKLSAHQMEHAIIQIGGGRLLVAEEKHTSPLTFRSLEALLHQQYKQKPGHVDETLAVLKFLKSQREVQVSKKLKRQGEKPNGGTTPMAAPPALPPPTGAVGPRT